MTRPVYSRLAALALACSLLAFAPGAWAGEGEEAPPPPPPEQWEPAGEVVPPTPTAGAEPRPFIPSPLFKLGDFELDAHARVQALFGLVGDDADVAAGDLLSADGFRLRRARVGLDGQIAADWRFALELDLVDEENGGSSLIVANVTWAPIEYVWVRAGAGKPGFSRTSLQSSGRMQLIERPLWVNLERSTKTLMLDLGHQVGLSVGGQASLFFYELGVYNGGRGFSVGDLNDGLLYLVRLGVGMGELGASEADLEGGDFRWRFAINGYLNYDAAAEIRGAGTDLSLKWNGLAFHAEALWAKAIPSVDGDVVSVLDESERWGMYAQAGYVLPLDLSALDLEVALRFAIMDDQVHIDDEGDTWELTAGVNVYFFAHHLKAMVNYVRREELHGADLSNDLVAFMLQAMF
ncbi:MAG TPA: porin [Myxococcota bacterium]|nr:porin [Myxococcota bacterium]HRY94213.1 porin [Myxococcota bacterium]